MAAREFVPVPPAGFDIAGSFNGVTTACDTEDASRQLVHAAMQPYL